MWEYICEQFWSAIFWSAIEETREPPQNCPSFSPFPNPMHQTATAHHPMLPLSPGLSLAPRALSSCTVVHRPPQGATGTETTPDNSQQLGGSESVDIPSKALMRLLPSYCPEAVISVLRLTFGGGWGGDGGR